MITVMGATGHTGRKVAEALLRDGEKVRALGRSEARLARLKAAGAEILTGDVTDAKFLAAALQGTDAAYALLPTDRKAADYRASQDLEGTAIVEAIRKSGLRHVVALSSIGAELSKGTGLIEGLHAQEARLKRLKRTHVLLLRPASFFENFYEQLELIRRQGIVANSVAPDLAMPMVGTRDIADVAVRALKARDWKGIGVRDLLGPRDLTYPEATRILGERIGKPDIKYVQLSYEDMAKAFVEAGLSGGLRATSGVRPARLAITELCPSVRRDDPLLQRRQRPRARSPRTTRAWCSPAFGAP